MASVSTASIVESFDVITVPSEIVALKSLERIVAQNSMDSSVMISRVFPFTFLIARIFFSFPLLSLIFNTFSPSSPTFSSFLSIFSSSHSFLSSFFDPVWVISRLAFF